MPRDRPKDRRRSQRFPLHLSLRWRSPGTQEQGEGKVVNISSAGILFTSARVFAIGDEVELLIHWSVELDRTHPLQLVVSATVVRREGDKTAVETARHEFRVVEPPELTRLRKRPSSSATRAWRVYLRKAGGSP